MAKSLVNLDNNVDFTQEPIFFGQELNLERYDKFRYPVFFEFFKKQMEMFWRAEEIDISKDKADYKNLQEHEKFIFTSNLKYQILLDSIQGRGIPHLTEYLSSPEVEAFCTAWAFFEVNHSYSYTYIIKNIYANPADIFDNILNDEQIIKRTQSVTKYYDDYINSFGDEDIISKKKKLYLTLISINILEGIRFYVSFSTAFALGKAGKMEGNSKIISLIVADENLHLGFTQKLIKELMKNPEEGFVDIAKELEPIVIQMYKDAAEEEMDWADYIFSKGSLLGLNAEISKQYMKYITNERMKTIGLEPVFDKNIKNPIPWINSYISSKGNSDAPQETDLLDYNIGAVKSDLSSTDFSDFEL